MTKVSPLGLKCDCGALAVSLCGTGGDYPTVVHCMKPVCKPDGHWCSVHRHRAGTMTYGMMNAEMRAEFIGFVAEGFWDHFVTFWWNLMPLEWKLRKMLWQHERAHPPPAPLPKLVIFYRGKKYVQLETMMVEEKANV